MTERGRGKANAGFWRFFSLLYRQISNTTGVRCLLVVPEKKEGHWLFFNLRYYVSNFPKCAVFSESVADSKRIIKYSDNNLI